MIDSLLYRLYIAGEGDTNPIDEIISDVLPLEFPKTKKIFILGEMIWSGWLSLFGLTRLFRNLEDGCAVFVDKFGIIYESCEKNKVLSIDLLNNFTVSLLCDLSLKELVLKEKSKIHTKDGHCLAQFKFNPKINKGLDKVFNLGLEINKCIATPQLLIKKEIIPLRYPKDVVFEIKAGDTIYKDRIIATSPSYIDNKFKLKFPKQYDFLVKDGDLVSANQVIAKKSLARGLVKDSFKSPVRGRVDLRYKNLGIIKVFTKQDTVIPMRPDFDGVVRDIISEHSNYSLIINTHVVEVPSKYMVGDDFYGVLATLKNIQVDEKPKVLLIERDELGFINEELIIKHSIVGIILLNLGYKDLEKFKDTLPDFEKYLSLVLISGFSIELSPVVDYFMYSMGGHFVKKQNGKLFIILNNQEVRPIHSKMRSKDRIESNDVLKKGDYVYVLNYFDSNSYARIEKVRNKEIILSSNDLIFSSNISNIIKYKSIASEKKEE